MLKNTCEQVFTWHTKDDLPLLVLIWHSGWKNEPSYWSELEEKLRGITNKHLILVTFTGNGIEESRDQEGGYLLPLLFRLLGQDPDVPKGCCPILAFDSLGLAPVVYDPNDRQVRLRKRTNEILGMMRSNESGGTQIAT